MIALALGMLLLGRRRRRASRVQLIWRIQPRADASPRARVLGNLFRLDSRSRVPIRLSVFLSNTQRYRPFVFGCFGLLLIFLWLHYFFVKVNEPSWFVLADPQENQSKRAERTEGGAENKPSKKKKKRAMRLKILYIYILLVEGK